MSWNQNELVFEKDIIIQEVPSEYAVVPGTVLTLEVQKKHMKQSSWTLWNLHSKYTYVSNVNVLT